MKITQDHKILDIVKGYKTPFHSISKKGQGLKTSDKFEATEYMYSILSLQNESFAESEINVAKIVLHVQTRLKRCIFFSSLEKKFKALCLLPLVRKLVQVPLPLLQFGTSTTNIHEIVKSANENSTQDNIKIINYLGDMLLIGYSLEEILMSRDTVIFLFVQHLGFAINWKSVLTPVLEIELLDLTFNSARLEHF